MTLRSALLRTASLWLGLIVAPTSIGATDLVRCEQQLAHLQSQSALPFVGPIQFGIQTHLFMEKTDGQGGINGDWNATRMLLISTFTPALPDISGGYPVEAFTIPAPGAERSCKSDWRVPNSILVTDCVGDVFYRISDAGIFDLAAQTMVGQVRDGVMELDLYFQTAGFPVLTGRPGNENTAIAIGLGARVVSEDADGRRWVRVVIGWNATPAGLIDEVELTHQLVQAANDADLVVNISDVQITSLGGRQIVADFQNLVTLPDDILEELVTVMLDWGQCDVVRTRTIGEMMPFGLPTL